MATGMLAPPQGDVKITTVDVELFTGADFGKKLQKAHDSGAVVLDCRRLTGAQTMSADVTFSHSVDVILGATTLTVTNDAQFIFTSTGSYVSRPPGSCADQSVFRGAGKQTTIVPANVRPAGKPLFVVYAFDCTFRDFTVSPAAADAADNGIVFDFQPQFPPADPGGSCLGNRLVNLLILHGSEGYGVTGGTGIRLGANTSPFYVEACRIAGYKYGILVQDSGATFSPNGIVVHDARIEQCDEGVRIENFGKMFVLESCVIEGGSSTYGLHVLNGIHILSRGNYYEHTVGTDIQMDGGQLVESQNDRFDGSLKSAVNNSTGKLYIRGGSRARIVENLSTGLFTLEGTWRQAGNQTGNFISWGHTNDSFNRWYLSGDSTSDVVDSFGSDLFITQWKTITIGGDGTIVGDKTFSVWIVETPVAWGTQHPFAITDTGGNVIYSVKALGLVEEGSTYIRLDPSDGVSTFLLLVADGTDVPGGHNDMFAVTKTSVLFDSDLVTDFSVGISVGVDVAYRVNIATKDAGTSGAIQVYNSAGVPMWQVQAFGRMEAGGTTFSRRLGDGLGYTARGLNDAQTGYEWSFNAGGYLALGPNSSATTQLFMTEFMVLVANAAFKFAAGILQAPAYDQAFTVTKHAYMSIHTPVLTNGAAVTDAVIWAFDANPGTHKALDAGTTKTTPGGVDAWVKIDVNGTLYFIPSYLSKTA